MESMQRLISEADARFEEKLKLCVANQPTNLNVYTDRTYSLRHQIAHNPQLTTDPHFMELLGVVEVASAPEYVSQGEIEKMLRSLLAGLLKTLLRECVGQPSYSLRKIIVEMIWHWHQDKQREILDFSLDRQYPGARHSRPNSAVVAVKLIVEHSTEMSEEEWQKIDEIQSKKAASKEENHDPTHVAHKLSLFRQRDLGAPDSQRKDLTTTSPAGSAVKVVYMKNAADKQRLLKQHIETHNGPSGPEVLVHQRSVAPFFNKRPTATFVSMSGGEQGVALTAQPADLSLVKAESRILSHLTQRLEQEQHSREKADMLTMLYHNQSRLDEESARRVESQAASSQAGRACHFILTKEGDPCRYIRPEHDEQPSLTPFDYQAVDDRIPSLVAELAGGGMSRIGSVPPPSLGLVDEELDVSMATECQVTAPSIRLDLPFREQMIAAPIVTSSTKGVNLFDASAVPAITRERLAQLSMADKVRTAFAESGAKGAHCTFRSAFKSVVRPTDNTFDECLALLPHPGDNFPSNPFVVAAGKRKPKPTAKR